MLFEGTVNTEIFQGCKIPREANRAQAAHKVQCQYSLLSHCQSFGSLLRVTDPRSDHSLAKPRKSWSKLTGIQMLLNTQSLRVSSNYCF